MIHPYPPEWSFVGEYVPTFDPAVPYPAPIPAMRPPYEVLARSNTPIYDALYSEYRRLFRALPGDRSGEEELRFTAFQRPAHPQPWSADAAPGRQLARRYCTNQRALPPGNHPGGNRVGGR